MSWSEKMHDVASSACFTIEQVLSLPKVGGAGDAYDREAHEAFTMLSSVPEDVRDYWMREYMIPEAAWLAWVSVAQIVTDVEQAIQHMAGERLGRRNV